MAETFDVSPEKEASILNFFYRQLIRTPAEVQGVSVEGKTFIVTGSNVGVGLECSRKLLDLGITRLILAVRNESKGQAAAGELSKGRDLRKDTIEVWLLDYSSYDSICSFVERVKSLKRLDIAILNAGIMTTTAVVVVINAATPGMVHDSEISRDTAQAFTGKLAEVFRRRVGYTSAVGARMVVDAAVNHDKETHGQYLGLQKVKPMALMIYTPEGERVREILWKETLTEFSFAGVNGIIEEIGNGEAEP
ncbi:hypothetical protein AAE478_004942 [Parahypoxylon ruwenzoriense]